MKSPTGPTGSQKKLNDTSRLRFSTMSQEEAIKLAKLLRPNLTKNKISQRVARIERLPNSAGIPLQLLFKEDTIESEPFQSLFGNVIANYCTSTGKSANFVCKKALRDILNGFLCILRKEHSEDNS